MKYFSMKFRDSILAAEMVWEKQDLERQPHTAFSWSTDSSGMTSFWTPDVDGENLLLWVLHVNSYLKYEVGTEQQVVTWLDHVFGKGQS
jgi:hypothetical protein